MNLLLAVDGSPGSLRAVDEVVNTPFTERPQVTLLYVLTRYVPSDTPLSAHNDGSIRTDEDRRAHAILRQAHDLLAEDRFEVAERIVEGHPAQTIVEVAQELGSELIVMGALGLTGWLRALLGTISLTVAKHAHCPVWVVKAVRKSPDRLTLLLPVDGSSDSRAAIGFLHRLPLPEATTVHLMHVVPSVNQMLGLSGAHLDPPVLTPLYQAGEALKQQAEKLLQDDREGLPRQLSDVHSLIAEGEAASQILEHAKAVEADLILLGTKGLSGLEEFFMGSVSHKVLKHAGASVLLVPHRHT